MSTLGHLAMLPAEILTEILCNLCGSLDSDREKNWRLCLNLEAIFQNLPHVYTNQEAFVDGYKAKGIVEFFPATAFWFQQFVFFVARVADICRRDSRFKSDGDNEPHLKTILQVALLDQLMPNIWTPERLSVALISIPIVRYLRDRIPNEAFYRPKLRYHSGKVWEPKESVLDRSVTLGNLELLTYLHKCFPRGFSKTALVFAAEDGFLEGVRVLLVLFKRRVFGVKALLAAVRKGRIKVVKALCEGMRDPFSMEALVAAVEFGDVEIAKILVESPRFGGVDAKVLLAARSGMRLPMLEFLVELVTRMGNWETLKGCAGVIVHDAARHGRLDVVELLQGAVGGLMKLSTDTMDEAAERGHLEVLEFLHRHRDEGCTVRAMDGAAARGYLEIVKFLHFNRKEGCTVEAMDGAAWGGSEGCTLKAICMDQAVSYCHLDVAFDQDYG
ncbi:hypothetical protein HDU97_003519 [Phlyctochytrium planicorne]|nr:hypothetical protein HDU97_003519 [Phlyctochytrium planicorne]